MTDLLTAPLNRSSHHPAVKPPEEFEDGGPAELTLPANDPGLHDDEYVARRRYFFQLARRIRTRSLPFPDIAYYEYEHETWRAAWRGLSSAHKKWACRDYLQGVAFLGLGPDGVPKANVLAAKLQAASGTSLFPAEGMIKTREFFAYLAQKKVPCSVFLRHGSHPEYGTEPDLIHDAIGHFPMLAGPEYAAFAHLLGRLSQRATPDQLTAIERLYLYVLEFGLIQEAGELKVFGAGLLSSYSETQHVFSDDVERRSLDIDDLVGRGFNLHSFQDVYYVIPSFSALVAATHSFIRKLGHDPAQI